jgi:hypothetical protein
LEGKLLFRVVILCRNSDKNQIDVIFKKCGTPPFSEWPGLTSYRYYEELWPKNPIKPSLKEYIKG